MFDKKLRRILLAVTVGLFIVFVYKPDEIKLQGKENYYNLNSTENEVNKNFDVEYTIGQFFKYIENEKFSKAYAMLDDKCKIDEFASQDRFKEFCLRYLYNKRKGDKKLTYSYFVEYNEDLPKGSGANLQGRLCYSYDVELKGVGKYIASGYTSREIEEFILTRKFNIDVVENGIYDYKVIFYSKVVPI